MAEPAIIVDGVEKSFKLPHQRHGSLKTAFVNIFKGRTTYEKRLALDKVSFQVEEGEFFGIIGRNGSGKSTLLKILAGVYSPDTGAVQIKGKLTPFIELGVGFNPELTGRENVFLNGALLGFNRTEMEAMYDQIVEFAELEDFMDQKLKNYSSGMQVRLAFSIAIRAESDILLLDEVLAVGDVAFQKKCLQYFDTLKKNKKTVIFVTHDMASVERYCSRVLVIDKSKQIGIYSPLEARNIYDQINATGSSDDAADTDKPRRWGNRKIEIESLKLFSDGNEVTDDQPAVHGSSLELRINLKHNEDVDSVVGLAFYDDSELNLSGQNSGELKVGKSKQIIYKLDALHLNTGNYHFAVGVFDKSNMEELDYLPHALGFRVVDHGYQKHGKLDFFGKWTIK